MKKCICILLTVCVFLSLFGCSEIPKVTDKTATPDTTASAVVDNTKPTDEPSEDGTVGDALWYEKIDFELSQLFEPQTSIIFEIKNICVADFLIKKLKGDPNGQKTIT